MRIIRIALVIALIMATMAAGKSATSAQVDGTTYASEKTGKIIDIGGSGEARFDLDNTYTDESGDYYQENIAIERGTSLIYVVFPSETRTPQQWEENVHSLNAPDYQVYKILYEDVDSESYSLLARVSSRLQF